MTALRITICAGIVCAAAQIAAPRIGMATDGAGRLRPIAGVAGNAIPGAPVLTGVISAAASDIAALGKTSSEIVAIEGAKTIRTPAPDGPALFAFAADGSPQWAWLCPRRELLKWTSSGFSTLALETAAIEGEVVAIGAADSTHLRLAVSRNNQLEILRVGLSDGAIAGVTSLPPGARAPLLPSDGSVLYAVPDALVLRDAGGHERRIPFGRTVSAMTGMSSRWVLVLTTDGRHFAVRAGDGFVFQLPEVH